VHNVDAREEPGGRTAELQGLGKGIRDAEVALRPIAGGDTFDQVAVDLLAERALALSPAAEDCNVVPTVGEPTGEDLDEPLDAADMGPEVGGHEQKANAGESRQIPLAVAVR